MCVFTDMTQLEQCCQIQESGFYKENKSWTVTIVQVSNTEIWEQESVWIFLWLVQLGIMPSTDIDRINDKWSKVGERGGLVSKTTITWRNLNTDARCPILGLFLRQWKIISTMWQTLVGSRLEIRVKSLSRGKHLQFVWTPLRKKAEKLVWILMMNLLAFSFNLCKRALHHIDWHWYFITHTHIHTI